LRTGALAADTLVVAAVFVAAVRLRGVEGVVKMNSLKNRCAIMAQRPTIIDEIRIKSTK
jgi:hypothetical protein